MGLVLKGLVAAACVAVLVFVGLYFVDRYRAEQAVEALAAARREAAVRAEREALRASLAARQALGEGCDQVRAELAAWEDNRARIGMRTRRVLEPLIAECKAQGL